MLHSWSMGLKRNLEVGGDLCGGPFNTIDRFTATPAGMTREYLSSSSVYVCDPSAANATDGDSRAPVSATEV